jgi:hypothetical protein
VQHQKGTPLKPAEARPLSLREIEPAVAAEGREWTRQRLQQLIDEEADRQGGVAANA